MRNLGLDGKEECNNEELKDLAASELRIDDELGVLAKNECMSPEFI